MIRSLAAPLAALLATAALPVLAASADVATCADPEAQPQTAVQACTQAIRSGNLDSRETARALVNLASAHIALGNFTPALKALDDAARRDPRLQPVFANRAYVNERLGLIDAALSDYGRALAMEPGDAVSLIGRGNLLLRQGRPELALQDFDAAVQRDRRDLDAIFNRGLAWSALGRPGEAVRDFSAVIAQRPDDAGAWLERGRAQARLEPKRGLADLDQAIRLRPEWAEAYALRGQLLDGEGRTKEADRDFLRAFDLGYQAAWLTERVAKMRGSN
jgi:tetratricopeptide (TPR) repeat protein